jgi:glycyl-tRNA synthetase alpha subunit
VHETILAKLSLHVELPTNVHSSTTSALVTATVVIEPSVPSSCQVLSTIRLIDIHLHAVDTEWAAGFWTLPITVIVAVGVRMVWADGVEIIVHTPFGTTVVNIELDISTKEIE